MGFGPSKGEAKLWPAWIGRAAPVVSRVLLASRGKTARRSRHSQNAAVANLHKPWMEFAVRRVFLGMLACFAASCPAHAQDCGVLPPNGPPLLHLSETATITVPPTLLVADLVASSQSPSAVTTQRHVNDLMARADHLAGKVPGIVSIFQDYSTAFVDKADGVPEHWDASQTLEIRGHSGEMVLGLVGQLQAIGLSLGNLGWQVPPDEADAAGRKPRLQALASLRQEAVAAAQTLDLSVEGYQSVDLTGGPSPILSPAPMQMEAAMAPPLASADSQNISATVPADVLLTAKTQPSKDQP
jgi:uncharacterized protein YggE